MGEEGDENVDGKVSLGDHPPKRHRPKGQRGHFEEGGERNVDGNGILQGGNKGDIFRVLASIVSFMHLKGFQLGWANSMTIGQHSTRRI